jgi:hypothetical protein
MVVVTTVTPDDAGFLARKSTSAVVTTLLSVISPVVPLGMGPLLAAAAIQKFRQNTDGRTGELLAVTPVEATQLEFPIGHPRRKVVYVGHPIDKPKYLPVAQFHTFLFEHKVAEALRLIRSLGAQTVEVVRIEGWDHNAGIHLSVPVPGSDQVELGASAERNRASGNYVMTRMTLSPTEAPHVPDGLVWFSHEPLWMEVAEARMRSGLTSFSLDVRSADDYGVNAGLKVLVSKSGLEAGGSFVEHQSTTWRLQGTFAK